MPPEELIRHLRERPFRPFRIHLTDTTAYDIRHPDRVVVGRHFFVIGIGASQDPAQPVDRFETVALLHVVRLETLGAPTPAAG
jgi:hypothetical protein